MAVEDYNPTEEDIQSVMEYTGMSRYKSIRYLQARYFLAQRIREDRYRLALSLLKDAAERDRNAPTK